MKKNRYVCTWCLLFLPFMHAQFIPTPQTCGAARSERETEIGIHETINHRIACMKAGYKNVYWGRANELEDIEKQFLPLEAYGINRLDTVTERNYIVLYTPAGERNARLLAWYLTEFETSVPDFHDKMLKGSLYYNDYLVGHLLGYSKKDIQYYYYHVLHYDRQRYEQDKKEAKEYIHKLLPQIENDMKIARGYGAKKKPQKDEIIVRLKGLKSALRELSEALNF